MLSSSGLCLGERRSIVLRRQGHPDGWRVDFDGEAPWSGV